MKFQFKSVLTGIKSTLIAIRNIDSSNPLKPNAQVHFAQECEILTQIFRNGLSCFEYYFVDPETRDKQVAIKDDKDVAEAFVSIFTFIDLSMFQETVCSEIKYLFDCILLNPFILAIPQLFLNNPQISANFSAPLLKYLVDNFKDLGGPEPTKCTVILRLFKLLFMALGLFPEQNERVFQPHLANIIMSSLKISSKTKDPANYFLLLKGLFRSIGGGKFESLYQEVLPVLQVLLESLNDLLTSSHAATMKELFVELILTVPVRLSTLLPHLSYLMRPLVIALQSGPELVIQSLKTFELCIDNLNQEFLDPIFAPVMDELMAALWQHIKPAPYNTVHSHTTLRILGKFGGRNRRILRGQSPLTLKSPNQSDLGVVVTFNGSADFQLLPIGVAIETANGILNASGHFQQKEAFEFLKSCTPLFFDADDSTNGLKQLIYGLIEEFNSAESGMQVDDAFSGPFPEDVQTPLRYTRDSFDESVANWLTALFTSCALPELKEDSWQLIENICRHFALIAIEETIELPKPEKNSSRQSFETLSCYSTSKLNAFMIAVVTIMSDQKPIKREIAQKAILYFHEICLKLLGSPEKPETIVAFQVLALKFGSQCYQPEWYKKIGGSIGLSIMTSKFGFSIGWILDHELEFVKSLLYVLKDTDIDTPYFDISSVVDTMNLIIRTCNTEISDEEIDRNRFTSLVSVLISELSNSNLLVRQTVQNSLNILSELHGKTVTAILLPVKDRLLFPIYAKPLRALPFALQIGYIDAIYYCLSLEPPLVDYSEELGRLLNEALALADAEDQALSGKDNPYKTAAILNSLRVECIKLLSVVLSVLDFTAGSRIAPLKNRILMLFFKCLYSKCPEVIQISNEGLTRFMEITQKLPKEMLQAGLKPILVNLSDHKKLTVAGLEGLARLLRLLTNYFKVEIGRKLLDHLRQWAEPQVLQELSTKPLDDSETILIISAILNVFYLLPPAASIFMGELVSQILDLESVVRRSNSSPFRKPLLRFLNRYSGESVDYFYEKFSIDSHAILFCSLTRSKESNDLSTAVFGSGEKMYSTFLEIKPNVSVEQALVVRNAVFLFQRVKRRFSGIK